MTNGGNSSIRPRPGTGRRPPSGSGEGPGRIGSGRIGGPSRLRQRTGAGSLSEEALSPDRSGSSSDRSRPVPAGPIGISQPTQPRSGFCATRMTRFSPNADLPCAHQSLLTSTAPPKKGQKNESIAGIPVMGIWPRRGRTDQPRATPWDREFRSTSSPERAGQGDGDVSPFQGRGMDIRHPNGSQGVALGWCVPAPSGRQARMPVSLRQSQKNRLSLSIPLQRADSSRRFRPGGGRVRGGAGLPEATTPGTDERTPADDRPHDRARSRRDQPPQRPPESGADVPAREEAVIHELTQARYDRSATRLAWGG